MSRFDSTGTMSHIKTHSEISGFAGTQTSIRHLADESGTRKRHDTSLNKNTINTPKNMQKFNFLRTN